MKTIISILAVTPAAAKSAASFAPGHHAKGAHGASLFTPGHMKGLHMHSARAVAPGHLKRR